MLIVRTRPSAAKRMDLTDFRLVLSNGSEIPAAQGLTFGRGSDTWIAFAIPRKEADSGALQLKYPDSQLMPLPAKIQTRKCDEMEKP